MRLTVSVARTTNDNSLMNKTVTVSPTYVIDVVEEVMDVILVEVMEGEGEVLEGDQGEEETSVGVAGVVDMVDVITTSTTNLKSLNLKLLTSLEIGDVFLLTSCVCALLYCHL